MTGPDAVEALDVTGWGVARCVAAVRDGVPPEAIVDSAVSLLARLPPEVLIGPPLVERARADAAALGAAIAAGADPATLPLAGVPFVVKDNIDVAGQPTTAGCPGFARVAARDATVVERLRAAGAIVVGKANLDQFATGLVGTRSPYGTPPNALRPDLVPGGSSSGSAVAVALGAVPFALGTDTAGSGRVPAALNGIVGLKPTLGRVSTAGIVPAVRRLDCPSVFARSPADAGTVLEALAGVDGADPHTRPPVAVRPLRWPPRVGVPADWPTTVGLTPDVRTWFERAVDALATLGASLVPIDVRALLELGDELYGGPVVAERTAAVGAAIADGVAGLDPVAARIIAEGARFDAVDAYRAEYRLAELRRRAAEVWQDVDVVALPTTPRLATVEDVRADPVGVNSALGRLTSFVNLADAAAVVVPVGPGVPVGLQLVAPAWHDDELIRLGEGYLSGRLGPSAPPATVVVVGAHLEGQPLNHQLTSRGAWCRERTRTAPCYRLHALASTSPAKPGLCRVAQGGAAIEVEVWALGLAELGSFLLEVPPPLCLGTVELADGSHHHGFLCEPWALDGAPDITRFGGWRAYLQDAGAR